MTFTVSSVVVGGHPRSGTTMLASLLSSHPEMLVLTELGVFEVVGAPPLEPYLARVRRCSYQHCGHNAPAWRRRCQILDQFEQSMRQRAPEVVRFEDALAGLRQTFHRPRILGDKYPDYLHCLPHFPDDPRVSFVLIYRDGRAVVNSAMKLRREGAWRNQPWAARFDHPATAAQGWLRAIRSMEEQRHRALRLRYEDLVLDCRRTLAPLADILGIDVRRFDHRIPQAARLDGWRQEMTARDRRLVEDVAGPTLQRLGYPLG